MVVHHSGTSEYSNTLGTINKKFVLHREDVRFSKYKQSNFLGAQAMSWFIIVSYIGGSTSGGSTIQEYTEECVGANLIP